MLYNDILWLSHKLSQIYKQYLSLFVVLYKNRYDQHTIIIISGIKYLSLKDQFTSCSNVKQT